MNFPIPESSKTRLPGGESQGMALTPAVHGRGSRDWLGIVGIWELRNSCLIDRQQQQRRDEPQGTFT